MFKTDLEFLLGELESRVMLAVDVSLVGDTLKVIGSGADDAVHISGSGVLNGELEVFVDTNNDGVVDDTAGTFGGASEPIRNIKVKLKGGDDFLTISAVDISGSVKVNSGKGSDCVDFWLCEVGGNLSAIGGQGNDLMNLESTEVAGSTKLKLGSGDDLLAIRDSSIFSGTVVSGSGDDVAFVDDSSNVSGGLTVKSGAGTDILLVTTLPVDPAITSTKTEEVRAATPLELGFFDVIVDLCRDHTGAS